ncbi:SHOCT domain-containing protein [Halobiforma nitratireducens]|uniref:SHOCT domain-containing protein n=1 Tax=Halobiforma nitratireducens JCM 10879 TaxID=1227454 RepID=M0LFM2_9EURY|nr:SHOCT domain-containing protein [Halobiforma nitratireducens]EMA32382.1 hypothetical protein C446_14759 [Halobiforma nitratireducens JCM 10879]
MGRLGTLLLKGVGVLVLAFLVLSAIATLVGIAFSIVVTAFSIAISLAVLGLFVLAVLGLLSLFGDSSDTDRFEGFDANLGSSESDATTTATADRPRDPESRLREQYVSGELSEAEFERELDRLLEDGTGTNADTGPRDGTDRSREFDRDRR